MHFDAFEILRMGGELAVGISIKLFCDNGRVHWRDFVNDFLFWVPGVKTRTCDGLGWSIDQAPAGTLPVALPAPQHETALPLAAK